MLDSNEARRLTNYAIDDNMYNVFSTIKDAASKGLYSVSIDLKPTQVSRLKALNFIVRGDSDTISW